MAVVSDIYDSINELARKQREAVQPASAAPVERTPDLQTPFEAPGMQTEVTDSGKEPAPSEAMQPMPAPAAEAKLAAEIPAPVETPSAQTEPDDSMKELPRVPSEAVQPAPVAEAKRAPDLKPAPVVPVSAGTSQASASSTIAVDWRRKYYRAVVLKRAGAILLDHIILFIALTIILMPFSAGPEEVFSSAFNWAFLILYFLIMPMLESSKWQGTIGKRILKLQITDREGERITFLRAFWRNIMRSVVLYSYFVSFGILLVIQYFRFNKTRKFFHDELSGTVIGERLTGSAAAPIAVNAA